MRSHWSLDETIRAILLLCCLLLASTGSYAKLVPGRDFRNGILDAELVVIVLRQSPNSFKVEEVFLGNASIGDSIELQGFRLLTEQQYGPDIIEPITANTRILLFLHHKKDAPATWEPTYFGYSFFWVQDPRQVTQLEAVLNKPWPCAGNGRKVPIRQTPGDALRPCGHFCP
jgi:hypothetical protein